MAAKGTKKKQLVSAYEIDKGTVPVSVEDFLCLSSETVGPADDLLDMHGFVRALAASSDIQAQIRLIQSRKGQVKQMFAAGSDSSASVGSAVLAVEVLLQLYLRPCYFTLRSSLEWVVEVFSRTALESNLLAQGIRDAVTKVCIQEWSRLTQFAPPLHGKASDTAMNNLIGAILSMNAMASFDSNIYWLQAKPEGDGFSFTDDDKLLPFMQFLSNAYIHCAGCICPLSQDDTLLSSSELLKYVECSGESMRAMMTVLKARRGGFVPTAKKDILCKPDESLQWRALCEGLLEASARVLQSEHANKDVITFTALCLLTVQRLLSRDTSPAVQLQGMLAHLMTPTSERSVNSNALHSTVAATATKATLIAKCALLRACLAVFDDAALMQVGSSSPALPIMLNEIFAFIMIACNDSLPLNRLYGFQTLESWIARLLVVPGELLLHGGIEGMVFHQMQENFRVACSVLTSAWSHPSRQVNHLVPNIYSKAVHAMFTLQSAFATMVGFGNENLQKWWNSALTEALGMPAHHRGRYQALNSLLPYMGACRILEVQRDIVGLLVNAVGTRDIAAAASGFLASLLLNLYSSGESSAATKNVESDEEKVVELRKIWSAHVVSALCHPHEHRFRVHTAEYLLPELLKVDPTCVLHMMREIRANDSSLSCKLWGIVNFTLQARLKGLSGQRTSCADGGVTERELYLACISADSELRLATLTALVSSSRSAAPIDAPDMRILKETLRFSLKNSDADHRHKVVRIVKAMFLRLKESSRVAEKDIVKLEKQIAFSKAASAMSVQAAPVSDDTDQGKATSNDSKKHKSRKLQQQQQAAMSPGDCLCAIDEAKRVVHDSFSTCTWMCSELLNNLYPGASCDREVMSLDLLGAMIEAMGADSAQMREIYTEHMIRTLINLFISSWDRSRRMAADLLLQIPRPLAGYITVDSAGALLRWGLELAGSAKLRESDAGALLIRDIYLIYAADLKWDLCSCIQPLSEVAHPSISDRVVNESEESACVAFLSSLCDRWNGALTQLEDVFSKYNMAALLSSNQQYPFQSSSAASSSNQANALTNASFPLCHGLLLALRFCLTESHKSGLLDRTSGVLGARNSNVWQPVVARIYAYAMQSLKLAMTIVAEAPSDVPFAPVPISAKGPVNSATAGKSMAASYINTNSTMGKGAGDCEETEAGATAQRAVVAAWLLVKESASLLSLLVSVSPPSGDLLLTEMEVSDCGYLILDALGRLKHMGAISEAQLALQSIATTLLRHGSKSTSLCRLPGKWLDLVLGRLSGEKQQQVFILRRSAGFAYSFLALLRAEPLNCTPTLLPTAMQSLLQTVRVGLEDAQNYNDGTDDDGEGSCRWKLAVHALNVLRLILCDASLGPDLNTYVAETAQLAVSGFTAPQWAVRNSCMMVFTAVAQRAVGTDKNDSAGAAVPTIAEFFQRFPALEPFLVSALTIATNSQDGVHPTLYPLLLLIAKLRVAVLEEGVGSLGTITKLVGLTDRCGTQKVQAVRVIAAKALRVLTPVSTAVTAASTRLQRAVQQAQQKQQRRSTARLDLNALHGHLVATRELLRSVVAYIDANEFTNAELVAHLRKKTSESVLQEIYLAVEVLGEVNCAALQIPLLECVRFVRNILLATEGSKAADVLLVQVCRQVLPVIYAVGQNSAASVLPFEPWLWRECIHSLVQISLCHQLTEDTGSLQDFLLPVEMIADLLRHRMSEVREGVLLGLLGYVENVVNGGALPDIVLDQLLHRVAVETEPPVAQLAMQLFTRVIGRSPLSSYSLRVRLLFHNQGSEVFNQLTCGGTSVTTALDVKQNSSAQAALEISGWIIADRQTSPNVDQKVEGVDWLERWVSVLEAACPDDQPVALRLSAARSLQHSALLCRTASLKQEDCNLSSTLLVRVSLVALVLLQDDDDEVREVANSLLVDASSCSLSCAQLASGSWGEIPKGYPTTEDFSLRALSSILALSLSNGESSLPQLSGGASKVWQALKISILGLESERVPIHVLIRSDSAALSQKIFEAEQDNLYVEHTSAGRVLVSALNAALRAGLHSSSAQWLVEAIEHCLAAVGQYKALIADSSNQSTYQPLLFRYFYLSFHLAKALALSVPENPIVANLKLQLTECSRLVPAEGVRVHPWISAELSSI